MPYDLNFPRANPDPRSSGRIKVQSSDFFVEEKLTPELRDVGEHVWLWVEKTDQNTEYVAKAIARFAGVRQMDVGFAGLKDRWAQTRQWFSVYLGNRPEPDWSRFAMEQVRILKYGRQLKKLRRGALDGNFFRIIIRDLKDSGSLEAGLQRIAQLGFPNYYGEQRFGRDGSNLTRGEAYFNREIKASRSQRSFYISAARSYLFNLNLSDRVRDKSWSQDTVGGPLYGDPVEGVVPLTAAEQEILDQYPAFRRGIHEHRLKMDRRPYCIIPEALSWAAEARVPYSARQPVDRSDQ